jgi:hypothetical protein
VEEIARAIQELGYDVPVEKLMLSMLIVVAEGGILSHRGFSDEPDLGWRRHGLQLGLSGVEQPAAAVFTPTPLG